jgi:type II secretory ATPase GspE/PulE/Tfp pilus assembly ATPase PilB-like protein
MSDKLNPEKENIGLEAAQWLEDTINKAVTTSASDIHIEPGQDKFLVRLRRDGILKESDSLSMEYFSHVISSLKVMAGLDISDTRKPQEGHILFSPKGPSSAEPVNLRLSVFPTIFGEAAVLRILDRKDLIFEKYENLGLDSNTARKLESVFRQSIGMVLVTGPGGAGKTTTLYTVLNSLQSLQRSIITLEDPVELNLNGVRQSQIRPEVGFNFAFGLRSILRQDPNVVMVGEIRDDETAEISIRASLMGILFLSTMHTTNAVGAIIRFLELDIPRSLVASALQVVIAQRLVRLICPYCKEIAFPAREFIELAGLTRQDEGKLYHGKGCNACFGTGYLRRTGVFEILFITKEIQRLIIEGAPFTEIEAQAKKEGMRTLKEAALAKALEGVTTLEEVIRVAPFF